jgi:hypothetical protein
LKFGLLKLIAFEKVLGHKPKSLPCSGLQIVVGVDLLAVGKTERCCGGCSGLEIVVGVDVLAVGKTERCCGGCGRGS